ncbi:MAG: FAD-dependent monooxygenase [Rhizobiales bacterium]|nr:FAD-dependent monooxygenase [Hyphomicrobiales bacterium]
MTSTRDSIVIAGAGIGGLTAAIALAAKGFRVSILEQAERIEEAGAGIQLPPNATRVLRALGLTERLAPHLVVPQAIRVRAARSGREIVRIPLGTDAEFRYGSPYWLLHRGDLQAALLDAVTAHRDITLKLGVRFEDYAVHSKGLTVQMRRGRVALDQHGIALVGADGLWSTLRARLGDNSAPRFAERVALRATIPAETVSPELREPLTQLWLGRDAHLVHYPIRGGAAINIVAIFRDNWKGREWSAPGERQDILTRFTQRRWADAARALLALPDRWLKWALYDRPPLPRWGTGPVTLLGDAAHPMLPFLAQGAAMAIEDAAILAECLGTACRGKEPGDPARALRSYESMRRARTARVQRAARRVGETYHLPPPASLARNIALGMMGGEKLRERYDWLYDWRAI